MEDHLITLAQYYYYPDYAIVKSKLESEGIEVFLRDDITVTIDPFLSNAIGGIKLQVKSSQAEEASKILKTIKLNSDKPENVDEIELGNRIFIKTYSFCPKCDSENVFYEKHSFLKSIFTNFVKREHYCQDCNNAWFQHIN